MQALAGIAAAFIAGLWGRGWIWAAIVLLVLLFAAMYARASTWFADVRRAAGIVTLTASTRPMEIAAIGYGGLVVILWLMVMKLF